ncbi:MAG: hypothetical protein L0Y70_11405 [Gemmataceae bacterium]|nr:hypothetical protein [Gemmataceae bacterium]
MDDIVLVKDLPHALIEDVIKELACSTVGFLRIDQARGPDADLLGSGVLVSVGAQRAILTAHHVLEVLPTSGRIGLLLGRTTQPHSIDTGGVSVLKIARGTQDSVGPDIGAGAVGPEPRRLYRREEEVLQLGVSSGYATE